MAGPSEATVDHRGSISRDAESRPVDVRINAHFVGETAAHIEIQPFRLRFYDLSVNQVHSPRH